MSNQATEINKKMDPHCESISFFCLASGSIRCPVTANMKTSVNIRRNPLCSRFMLLFVFVDSPLRPSSKSRKLLPTLLSMRHLSSKTAPWQSLLFRDSHLKSRYHFLFNTSDIDNDLHAAFKERHNLAVDGINFCALFF